MGKQEGEKKEKEERENVKEVLRQDVLLRQLVQHTEGVGRAGT